MSPHYPRSAEPPLRFPVFRAGPIVADLRSRILTMAIVNRTPDSFHDRGATFALDAAIGACDRAAEAGAEIVDIGGVKFAPGAEVAASIERGRVVPVVRAAAARGDVAISVDTFRADVAAPCIEAGAAIINDTSGLADPDMAHVIAETGAVIVITHSLAAPRTPHPSPHYGDVVEEVVERLRRRVDTALEAGIAPDRIIVDPGHDLNKTTEHSLELTRRLGEVCALGYPVLAAVSNKDFIGESVGVTREERLAPSLAASVVCVENGARILRMHDARATVLAARMLEVVHDWRQPMRLRHNQPGNDQPGNDARK